MMLIRQSLLETGKVGNEHYHRRRATSVGHEMPILEASEALLIRAGDIPPTEECIETQ